MNSIASSIKPVCVLVLGMHRSGTSALTRCLNLVGMDLGSNLLSPQEANAKGFWEHADAVRINDQLLASFGLHWYSLDPLPQDWLATPAADAARADIRLLVERDFTGVPLWGIKDPRMCRLAPLWIDVLQDMGVDVVSVLMVRSPVEVALSLHRAHKLTMPHGVRMWALHLAESEIASRAIPRVMVDYNELLSDAVSVMHRIGADLHLPWPITPSDRREALLGFLDEGLRTHRRSATAETVPAVVTEMVLACAAIVKQPSPAHWHDLADLSPRVEEQMERLAYLRDSAEHAGWIATWQLTAATDDWAPRAVLYYGTVKAPDYSEQKAIAIAVSPGRSQFTFELPVMDDGPVRLRFDPLNRRGAFILHSLQFLDSVGQPVWDWSADRDSAALVGIREEESLAQPGRHIAFTDSDPQINVDQLPDISTRRVSAVRVDMECLDTESLIIELEALTAQGAMERSRMAELIENHRRLAETSEQERQRQAEANEQDRQRQAIEFDREIRRREALHEQALQVEAAQREQLDARVGQLTSQLQTAQESGRREIDRLTAIQISQARELAEIQSSTSWRVLLRLRGAFSRIPMGMRRRVRRLAKAAWWAVTPWRIPARLRFIRQRNSMQATYRVGSVQDTATLSPAPSAAISFVPNLNGVGAGHYALASGDRRYTYVPPRPPVNIEQELAAMKSHPLFSIVVPVYNTPPSLLDKLVGSVLAQWYPHWELILVNDNSSLEHVRRDLDRLVDSRILVVHLAENKRISQATNEGIACATGEYIVFADHDDELTADCLYELARCVGRENPDFIYSDEDKIAEDGQYVEPFFKPDWSPDTMMSTMYTCHVSCVRRALVNEIGGLRQEYDGSQDWDFVLRVVEKTNRIAHIPKVLYHWRIIPASVASDLNAKPYAITAGKRAREDALTRRGLVGELEPVSELPGYFRVTYRLQGEPSISIIIPSKNNYQILKQCIDSIESTTTYRNFEIIVIDNGSTDNATLQYLEGLRGSDRIKLLSYEKPFNYSAINNLGAAEAKGDLLLFLNDDTEVLVPDWLERLGGYAQLTHVGAVGAKLLYPGGQRVQHVGVTNLASGPAHAFLGVDAKDPCYFARAMLEYNWLAVTGACLMIERTKFERIGRFDENLPVAYNDVDLCFRAFEAGLYNLVCPSVTLIHHESYSRGLDSMDSAKRERLGKEMQMLYQKHPRLYQNDPFHNPNLGARDAWFRGQ